VVRVQKMILGEVLRQHGIASAAELGRRLSIARKHAWLLWTGRHLPSYDILHKLTTDLHIPPEELANLERAHPKKDGRRRRRGKGR
jgi:transcriptional regulator with XRE-family HTH domain